MSLFELAALFLLITGVLGWLNARYLHLPAATVMTAGGLLGALVLAGAARIWPGPDGPAGLVNALTGIDFPQTVMEYLLGFLLFAGAMQVNWAELSRRKWAVGTLASLGVLGSTAIIGLGVWGAAQALGLELGLAWALVFGALISPTDPVAVLAAVRSGGLSKTIETVLQGEALFNDGIGIVLFTVAVAVAVGGGEVGLGPAALHALLEAFGGAAIGGAGGWLAIRLMRSIDEYAVEVGITLALATGVYALAHRFHLSGPIAVVVAGLMVGERGFRVAMSETTRRYVRGFWTLVDELLTALLFLLLGLEVLVVPFELRETGLWAVAIALAVGARIQVIAPWGSYFQRKESEQGAGPLLAWGGLHGALSLALALTLPAGGPRELILGTTFAVVIFSVGVQGITFPMLARRFKRAEPSLAANAG